MNFRTKTPKVRIVLEIDQSKYLADEDYDGLSLDSITDRFALARILEKDCLYPVIIRLENDQSR